MMTRDNIELYLELFRAVVRASLAWGLVGTFCYLAIISKIDITVFVTVVIMAVAWFNREKEDNKKEGGS